MISAGVFLWGTKIGVAYEGDGERIASFQYEPDFVKMGIEVAPLTMPLSNAVYSFPLLPYETFKGLPGLLSDSLPDKYGNAVIDAWLASRGRPKGSLTSIERLCYMGTRAMGALEFRPSLSFARTSRDIIEINDLVNLSSSILSEREGLRMDANSKPLSSLINVGTSAGGARAKAILAYDEKKNVFRSGQVDAGDSYTYWIVKFDGVSNNRDKESSDTSFYTRIEYAYYLMAREAGLAMSESRLFVNGGLFHFMSKRFDRFVSGGKLRKLHMLSLGAMAHFDYNEPGRYSYEEAAQTMMRLGLGQNEIEEFFRRLVFNVMARNQDDHVKNISFLMDKNGVWSLSPAYDVTFAYNPEGRWTGKHQMLINGRGSEIAYDDLLASGAAMNLSPSKVKAIILKTKAALLKWTTFAKEAFLTDEVAHEIEKNFVLTDISF